MCLCAGLSANHQYLGVLECVLYPQLVPLIRHAGQTDNFIVLI